MCSTPKNSGHTGGIRKLKENSFDSSYSAMLRRASQRFERRQQEKSRDSKAD